MGLFTRVATGAVATATLVCFTNAQLALAADDGTCAAASIQATGGRSDGGGGWLSGITSVLGWVGNRASDVGKAVSGIDWGRVGRDAWAFTKGFVVGAATTLAFVAAGSALIAAGIVSAPVILVAGIAIGVVGLGLLGWQIYQNHSRMTEEDWFGLGGNLTGGLVAGFGAGPAVSRGVSSVVGGLMSRGGGAAADIALTTAAPHPEPAPLTPPEPEPVTLGGVTPSTAPHGPFTVEVAGGGTMEVSIPTDYVPRVADNGRGIVWQRPGATGNADMIRVMEPTTKAPNGYIRIYNSQGQPVNALGKPLATRGETHFDLVPEPAH